MNNFFENKKGQTVGDSLLYALVTLFGLGLLQYFAIEIAVVGNLMPSFKNYIIASTISPAVQTTILSNYDHIIFFLRAMPFILFVLVIIFLAVRVFKTERESTYD